MTQNQLSHESWARHPQANCMTVNRSHTILQTNGAILPGGL
ncbi:hypothetical protein ABND49_09470 [Paenibacillus larvae]